MKTLHFCLMTLLTIVAVPASAVDFNITGIITVPSCSANLNGTDKTVSLGEYFSSDYQVAGKTTELKLFTISVDCLTDKNVSIYFEGSPPSDASDTGLLGLTAAAGSIIATNVGIALFDEDKNQILLNNSSQPKIVQAGITNLTFYSAYKTYGNVTAGEANGVVAFTIQHN